MKVAKIYAILIAIILAVFCFGAPSVFGGDEHPWDEEGYGNQGGSGAGTSNSPHGGPLPLLIIYGPGSGTGGLGTIIIIPGSNGQIPSTSVQKTSTPIEKMSGKQVKKTSGSVKGIK